MTERERLFVEYWEVHRLREKGLGYQLLTGLPMGLLFGIPIILILFSGRFWYKRADMVANSEMSFVVLIVAILLIAMFVAVIYKRHQWEMKEQQYLEIKARNRKDS
jgi:hypothetical protein